MNSKKQKITHLFISLSIYFIIGIFSPIFAAECDPTCSNAIECTDKIKKCQEAWNQMEAAKKPHVDSLKKMESDIEVFKNRIKIIETDLVRKAAAITIGEKELTELIGVVSAKIRKFYISSVYNSPLFSFFSKTNVGEILRTLTYQQVTINENKKSIAKAAVLINELEDKKSTLENEHASLAYLKTETDKRAESVRKLVKEAESYQSKLSGFIASLTTQQETILNAKGGTFTTSVGDVPLTDDPNSSPNYNPGFSPAFAGFAFGAYTHKKGMSQYGAKGRANSGQNYQDILRAYYNQPTVNKDTGGDISVSGFGNMNFEDRYLLGIAEMPSTFPKEALKAQAIAARSYAYRYKTTGQTICITESCQVFSNSKANNPPSEWRQAVNETRGQIIEGVTTFYSSTTGGYSTTSGWDTKCGNQGCWTGDAYEKIAGSPWFYKGWYTEGYYNTSAKCGRNHPWLNNEEFADILNAWQIRKNGGGDSGRILPITINSCPIGGATGNPYSMNELRDLGGFTSVSGIAVTYNSNGYTDTVILQTNKGEVRIAGNEFKESFNLRAPGYISIRSTLYNIEKK